MRRKIMAFFFVGALAVVLGAVAVGGVLAQQGKFAHIYTQAKGDDTVVARVSGLPITRDQVRMASESRRAHNRSLSRDEADRVSIVALVGRKALVTEAIPRELKPSTSDTNAYIARHKEDCEAAGQVCRNAIADMGFAYDDYWKIAAPDFEEALTITRLHADNYQRSGIADDASEHEVWEAREAMGAKALKAATVIWEDRRLRRLYEKAVAN